MKTLSIAVVDSSAIIAILQQEISARVFLQAFTRCQHLVMSEVTFAECLLVVLTKRGENGVALLDQFLAHLGVRKMPTDERQLLHFRQGLARFGKGQHPAGLNFGDLFAYALAKSLHAPLFFQGLDFSRSDILSATAELGYAHSPKGEPLPL